MHYIDNPKDLASAAAKIAQADEIGVDTESDSMHCYFEKVCFIQVKAAGEIYIVDTIRLRNIEPLVEVFNDSSSLKILHGADYDVSCLARDFGVQFGRLYDTMLAAQYLDRPSLGLAALCQEHFDVEMDKSLTRYNWALRPLADKYLEYIAADVRFLSELRVILQTEIEAADLAPELENEFEKLRHTPYVERPFDPESYRRIKGSQGLDPLSLAVLKSLVGTRDELARRRDLPPFKVMNNKTLLDLAQNKPESLGDLDGKGPRSRFSQRYGAPVIEAVRRALDGEVVVTASRRKKGDGGGAVRFAVTEALRKWRQAKAQELKQPSTVILPKHVMMAIAETQPRSRQELEQIEFFGERRLQRFGPEILGVVDGQRET